MGSLFAEAFSVSPLPDEGEAPALRYDEERALNVLPGGQPFVEMHRAGDTVTLTEVRNEIDDFDRPGEDELLALDTVTKVRGERQDYARDELTDGTQTRVRGEKDDFASGWSIGGTMTKTFVRAEADDTDPGTEDLVSIVTKTAVPREADDFWPEGGAATPLGAALLAP